MQLLSTTCIFELRVSNRSGRFRHWSNMHLALADFNDFAKPFNLARACDIFSSGTTPIAFYIRIEISWFPKMLSAQWMLSAFAKTFKLAWTNALFDVNMTP